MFTRDVGFDLDREKGGEWAIKSCLVQTPPFSQAEPDSFETFCGPLIRSVSGTERVETRIHVLPLSLVVFLPRCMKQQDSFDNFMKASTCQSLTAKHSGSGGCFSVSRL